MMALLAENGPCHVQKDLTTKINPYSWNRVANIIWLDQPTGVGFSYGADVDYDSGEVNVQENIYWFLQEFFKRHPELQGRKFFVTGESYGGHYVPAAASYIVERNMKRRPTDIHINLAGIAIGNGLTDPLVQYKYSVDMAYNDYNVTLADEETIVGMKAAVPKCGELIERCQEDSQVCLDAYGFCSENLELPFFSAKRNPYDIRQACEEEDILKCFHFEQIDAYLNSEKVKKYLNIDEKHSKPWRECDSKVGAGFLLDEMRSYSDNIRVLLEAGARVLVYAGDADLMCNWVGNEAWTKELEWSGKKQFNEEPNRPFITSDLVQTNAGMVRSYDNFAFIRIFQAGHMVPMDQPAVCLEMISKFFNGEEF
jgi:carboxypeptidase C (cathepsin A)